MIEKQTLTKRVIHICIVAIIIVAIVFSAMMMILKYDENGEINMPFFISKISIISTVDGQDVENPTQKWEKIINQNNDIYLYVEKNNEYKKTETISSIILNNFKTEKNNNIGEIKFYKQSENEKLLYENKNEYIFNELEFKGAKYTNSKKQEISNQGGIIEFRCAQNKIGTYSSNEDEEINYNELLKKINIKEEDLSATISFDIILKLDSGKVFKAENINLNIPNPSIIEQGKVGIEIEETNKIVFKRIEN